MTLHDLIVRFTATRSKADLAGIKRKYGEFGFFMACKAAGITRRVGRQILGIAEHDYRPHQLASGLGYRISQPNYHGKEIDYDSQKNITR